MSVLVIGAGSDIGTAISRSALAVGHKVVRTMRSPSDADDISIDVTSDLSVESGIKRALHLAGTLSAVIYLPAISVDALVHKQTSSAWLDVFNVNVVGAARVAKHLLPHFMRQRAGILQFVSSTAAVRGETGAAPYACSKAALNCLARSIAVDYGRFNVRAYAIMPGYVDGGMLRSAPPEKKNEYARKTSLNRLASVDEIAAFSVKSLDACDYLTGTTITLDGGLNG